MGVAESRINIREIRAIRFKKEFLRFLRFPRLKVRKILYLCKVFY